MMTLTFPGMRTLWGPSHPIQARYKAGIRKSQIWGEEVRISLALKSQWECLLRKINGVCGPFLCRMTKRMVRDYLLQSVSAEVSTFKMPLKYPTNFPFFLKRCSFMRSQEISIYTHTEWDEIHSGQCKSLTDRTEWKLFERDWDKFYGEDNEYTQHSG